MTTKEKKDSIDHPLYEMEMLFQIPPLYFRTDVQAVKNSLFESFVIHARALDEFFRSPGQKRDSRNMHADNFVPCKQWTPLDSDLIDRMNREVCHIGKSRRRPEDRNSRWNFGEVTRLLAPRCLDFLRRVAATSEIMEFKGNGPRVHDLIGRFSELSQTTQSVRVSPATHYVGSSSPVGLEISLVPLDATVAFADIKPSSEYVTSSNPVVTKGTAIPFKGPVTFTAKPESSPQPPQPPQPR